MVGFLFVIALATFCLLFRSWYKDIQLPEWEKLILEETQTGELRLCFSYAHKYSDFQIANAIASELKKWEDFVLDISEYTKKITKKENLYKTILNAISEYRQEETVMFNIDKRLDLVAKEIQQYDGISLDDAYIKATWLRYGNTKEYKRKAQKYWLDMKEDQLISIQTNNRLIRYLYD